MSRFENADASDCPPDLPDTLSPEARERIKEKLRNCQ
jgi:hypothetical protein